MRLNKSIFNVSLILFFVISMVYHINLVSAGEYDYHQGILQKTKYGAVEGYKADNTLIWKGIPYAKAPIGELRWKAPQDAEPWQNVRKATENGNLGIQGTSENIIGSEDCLNLNIYRPDSDETNLPVLVYIHGGNNQLGTNEEILPENLAVNADCIVISLNYRLGLLGFNCLPALKTGNAWEDSGNYTLLDFAKSLDWIKDNIESFGGNPNNITISGFSAGGRDVMAMLISPIFKGKFQKAISFSGGMTTADPKESSEIIAKHIAPLVVEDGIKDFVDEAQKWLLSDKKEVREYLYNLSADRLAACFGNAGIRMKAFPHLYTDGTVLPKEGFETAEYNQVPLIMLTGTKEFSGFAMSDPYFKDINKDDMMSNDKEKLKELDFCIKYGSNFYELFNAEESALKMAPYYKKAPIYTCAVNWGNDESIVGKQMAEFVGATHGIFLPLLTDKNIGVRAQYPTAFNNDGVKDLTKVFQSYIKNFLWTGNPNRANLLEWKAWTDKEKGSGQMIFDADMDKADLRMIYEHKSYDNIVKSIETDNSLSADKKLYLVKNVLNGRWFSKGLDEYFSDK